MPYTLLGYFLQRRKVEGVLSDPPTDAPMGAAYIVGPNATGEWAGNEDRIATQSGEGWRYICPDLGLRVFNDDTQEYIYNSGNGWLSWPPTPAVSITVGAPPPQNPQDGDLWVDTEP